MKYLEVNTQKGFAPIALFIGILVLIVAGGGYYFLMTKGQPVQQHESIVKQSLSSEPTTTPSPTDKNVTSQEGINTVVSTLRQGDLTLKIMQKDYGHDEADIHLINTKTNTDKLIGQTFVILPGNRAVFSKDSTEVIFSMLTKDKDAYAPKLEGEGIVIYSIPNSNVIKGITLGDIKNALPSLSISRNAALNSLSLSPDGDKIAMSYGYTYEMDSGSDIIVISLPTGKINTVNAKGLVKGWKDNSTIQYQVTESSTNGINIVTKEVNTN